MTDDDPRSPGPRPPYRVEVTARAAGLQAEFADLPAGGSTGRTVTVAGRAMLLRTMGKRSFVTLRDSSGAVQLMATADGTERYRELTALNLGDWVMATGEVVRSRTGELSVEVAEWHLLAEARRQFGDKWHGVTDPDLRYRQRYVDLWANEHSRAVFQARSRVMSLTRRFLDDRGFVEFETPVFHPIPGGALARPFVTHHNALDIDLYLRIATELHLKRLVVGGFERVYELGRIFRNEGLSPRHNPEFTMLELYQAFADYDAIMTLVEEMMDHLICEVNGGEADVTFDGRGISLRPPYPRLAFAQALAQFGDVDADGDETELRSRARDEGINDVAVMTRPTLLDELFKVLVEPNLQDPMFITDHPRELSPLAKPKRGDPRRVERFELIVAGREIANAFSELN
ncbi:MAG: lysine--tRNA ligase, partial [Acidimicrobiales bacterium]